MADMADCLGCGIYGTLHLVACNPAVVRQQKLHLNDCHAVGIGRDITSRSQYMHVVRILE